MKELPSLIPHGGEMFEPQERKYQETVIMVPFFGSKRSQLSRHKEYFLSLGYRVVQFNLDFRWKFHPKFFRGMKSLWADQIAEILDFIPGPKIIFSFSNPSASAIEACVRRNCEDLSGLICDSGPSGDFYKSVVGLLKFEKKITSPLKLYPMSLISYFFWSPGWNKNLWLDIEKLPLDFPILTIQGGRDPLISSEQIDRAFQFFKSHSRVKLLLPEAGHLNGLKDFKEEYISGVGTFLQKTSRPL